MGSHCFMLLYLLFIRKLGFIGMCYTLLLLILEQRLDNVFILGQIVNIFCSAAAAVPQKCKLQPQSYYHTPSEQLKFKSMLASRVGKDVEQKGESYAEFLNFLTVMKQAQMHVLGLSASVTSINPRVLSAAYMVQRHYKCLRQLALWFKTAERSFHQQWLIMCIHTKKYSAENGCPVTFM